MLTQEQIQAYAKKIGASVNQDAGKPVDPLVSKLTTAWTTPAKEEIGTFGKVVNTIADFTGGKALAQGIGKAIAKPMVEARAAQETITAKDKMNAMVSELDSAFKQGRTEDVKRLQEAIRQEIDSSYLGAKGAKTLTDFQSTVPTNKEIVGSTVQLGALTIPGAPKGSNLLTKTAVGAGTGYAFDVANKLQDENIDIEKAFTPGLGTALGASIPLLSAGFSKVMSKGRNVAEAEINSLIKPKQTDLAYGKNPAKAIVDEGLKAKSLDELGNKVQDTLSQRIKEAASRAKNTAGIVDVSSALSPLDDAMQVAAKQNNQAAVNRLQSVKEALTNTLTLGKDGKIISQGARDLSKLSIEDALNFKREVGSITAFTGNPSDDKLVNSALKKVFGNAKGLVEKQAPELTKDIEHISSLIGARNSIENRITTLARQNLVGFTDKVVGTAGVLGSILTLNPIPVLAGFSEIAAHRLLSSPAFKTAFAQWAVKAPKSQIIQLMQEVPWTKLLLETKQGISQSTP